MKNFPPSPFKGHAFIENTSDGSLLAKLPADSWYVVLRRDGMVLGPKPVGNYRGHHIGTPDDVIAFHVIEVTDKEQQNKYRSGDGYVGLFDLEEDSEEDLKTEAPSATKQKCQSQPEEEEEFVRPAEQAEDPFSTVIKSIGILGAIGTIAFSAFTQVNEIIEREKKS